MVDFFTALGLVLIVEGVPYFLAPEKMRQWVLNIALLPDSFLQKTGLILMVLGLMIIYMVRGLS
ncbi:MAG: DUF2065 domain-containing protein [Magnetococcus sp. DMHC-6]